MTTFDTKRQQKRYIQIKGHTNKRYIQDFRGSTAPSKNDPMKAEQGKTRKKIPIFTFFSVKIAMYDLQVSTLSSNIALYLYNSSRLSTEN